MASQSKDDYRTETMRTIREDAIKKMNQVIENCYEISKELSLPKRDIPNIIVAYNNRILLLEKEFLKSGIDFYDREVCETRFIIENFMQGAILLGKNSLLDYLHSITKISEKDKRDFIATSKKIDKNPKAIKKFMKDRKHPLLSNEQIDKSEKALNQYLDYYDKVADFTISNDIVQAILFYKVLANARCVVDFDTRIEIIDFELRKLGYESIKDTVFEQMEIQDLSLKNIDKLESVRISKKILEFKKR